MDHMELTSKFMSPLYFSVDHASVVTLQSMIYNIFARLLQFIPPNDQTFSNSVINRINHALKLKHKIVV